MQPVAPRRHAARIAVWPWPTLALVAPHLFALAVMVGTEQPLTPMLAFLLGWVFFNAFWIVLIGRPAVAGLLTLLSLVLLILLSRLKHEILLMTVNFVDLMMIDADTTAFLLQVFPQLGPRAALAVLAAAALVALVWRLDVWRVSRLRAAALAAGSLAALVSLSTAVPNDPWEEFHAENYFSKYVRSGVTAAGDLVTRGILDQDRGAVARLAADPGPCTVEQPPHVIVIHDESSFDARAIPGIKVPEGYGEYFRSFDGRARTLLVEGPGGPSWYTEYNILTGLSARSYGRFIDFATRIAAGRVERGFAHNFVRCGYRTTTLYPMYGAFLSARRFQETAGIQRFLDSKALGASFLDPDAFYFNAAADLFSRERGQGPQFMLVYTAQNHFPWTSRYRPDLARDWKDLGNRADVDEYLRRQHLTEVDYKAFIERLKREFPAERFLIVRFGDHQPYFARHLIDPAQDDTMLVRRVAAADPRFLATYYAIEAINFTPKDLSSSLDVLDAPHLPLAVLEAAGVPLDPSFREQKAILRRCRGLLFRCNGGEEARRFNRQLIEAGMIKGL
jgi:hypothetical protein